MDFVDCKEALTVVFLLNRFQELIISYLFLE